jgi:uncharacterized protein (TIGR03032 family)
VLHSLLSLDGNWSSTELTTKALVRESKDQESESDFLSGSNLDEQLKTLLVATDSNSNTVDYHPDLALQVGLLAEAFPDAKFIHVLRAPAPAIASGMRAWSSGKFVTHPNLEQWWGEKWSFGLIEGWRELIGKPLAEVVANQYITISNQIIDDLEELDPSRVARVSYEALIESPKEEILRLTEQLNLPWQAELPEELPLSPNTLSKPDPKKWANVNSEIFAALATVGPAVEKSRMLLAPLLPTDPQPATSNDEPKITSRSSTGTPFSSSYTQSFSELLRNAGISLVVSTYKSGHVITVRADASGVVNTSFKAMNRPMGIAVAGNKLAIGTADSIHSFLNQPALTKVVEPVNSHDGIFSTRATVHTGDIAIHEMGYGVDKDKQELWFVNTKFSCLSKQDLDFSFVPTWRPKWISALAPEDRCHLNGLAMVQGKPKYVTALSQTDTENGWREEKGTSGVIVDIETDRVIAEGLAMPHSPRWHNGKLWFLESGKGTLSTVDPETGKTQIIATLPGFTRGLTFFRSYAFIGLSQVRESVFKELPVTEQKAERNCGVWVVDTRTGNIVAFLKFQGIVQELFDVAIIGNARWPDIVDADERMSRSYVLDAETLKQIDYKPRSEAQASN